VRRHTRNKLASIQYKYWRLGAVLDKIFGGAEWYGVWGGCPLIHPQQTRIFRGRLEPPSELRAEPRPETHFGVFWRLQNTPFCTYMPMLWVNVKQCFMSHLGKRLICWGGGIAPTPQNSTTHVDVSWSTTSGVLLLLNVLDDYMSLVRFFRMNNNTECIERDVIDFWENTHNEMKDFSDHLRTRNSKKQLII